jgi:hypothetical protein
LKKMGCAHLGDFFSQTYLVTPVVRAGWPDWAISLFVHSLLNKTKVLAYFWWAFKYLCKKIIFLGACMYVCMYVCKSHHFAIMEQFWIVHFYAILNTIYLFEHNYGVFKRCCLKTNLQFCIKIYNLQFTLSPNKLNCCKSQPTYVQKCVPRTQT